MPEQIDTKHFELEVERLQRVVKKARVICHEMKQPLMAMSGYLELLQMEMAPGQEKNGRIDKINVQFQKLNEISNKLSNLVREET